MDATAVSMWIFAYDDNDDDDDDDDDKLGFVRILLCGIIDCL